MTTVGLVAGVVYGWIHLQRRESMRATAAAQRDFNEAARKYDTEGMRAALDAWAAAAPRDPTPPRYRAMLDSGEAEADSPEMAVVFLALHVAADRLPEAAREAEKVLKRFPKHWQARCVLAHHALQVQRDPVAAGRILDQLPDPEDPAADLRIGGVLYALRLFDAVGRDGGELRRVIVRRLVPITRSSSAAEAPASAKAQLLACYLEPFSDATALTELGSFWAAADKLAEDATTEAAEAGDIATLIRLAELGSGMRTAFTLLRNHDPNRLPPERFQPLLRAIDDRTRRAWTVVREKAPQRPESYRGLTNLHLLSGDPVAAVQTLLDGLMACGDRTEFLEMLVVLMARFGTDESVRGLADTVLRNAEAAGNDPEKWCLAAQAALVVQRHDVALAACRRALAAAPNHPWACAVLARLLVRAGKFFEAREALAPLGETALLVNPSLTRIHASVLVGTGLWILRDEEFKKVLDAQGKLRPKTSLPAVEFLRGVLDTPPDVERASWVAAAAQLITHTDPPSPYVQLLKVEALVRLAELTAVPHPEDPSRPPVWNAARVGAALRAIDELPPDQRADASVIAAVVLLQLKGRGDAATAMRIAAPLFAMEATVPTGQLELLGAVLVANQRPADAIRLLEPAVRRPGVSAGFFVTLATAYHNNRQPIEARAAIAEAERIPNRSDREQAELIAAKILLQGENR
jgi:predicted Zn-dependent protease